MVTATSQAALASVEPNVTKVQRLILKTLRNAGKLGMTDHEMQLFTGLNGSTQRPRRIELERQGLVFDSGLTRETSTGRQATIWLAKEFAR